jgi:hypothetical protein
MKMCKKCGNEIPKKTVVNGITIYASQRNFCLVCVPIDKNKKLGVDNVILKDDKKFRVCDKCEKELELNEENFHKRSRGDFFRKCRKCEQQRIRKGRSRNKKFVVDYMGGRCIRCGYNRCYQALELHHKDGEIKEYTLSSFSYNLNNEEVVKELKKCILLCANCHREVEYGVD